MFSSISFPFIAKIVRRQTGNYSKKSFFSSYYNFFHPNLDWHWKKHYLCTYEQKMYLWLRLYQNRFH